MMDSDTIVNNAISMGFTSAAWLNDLTLECEARLRAYCNKENCTFYGTNWVCPPGCGSLEECESKIRGFDRGLLLQSVWETDPASVDYIALKHEHNLRLHKFLEAYCERTNIFTFSIGGCFFCESCAYPNPCAKPEIRMDSLCAFGIDAGKLCEAAGLEYSFRPDRVYYIALILAK